jgi:hypothetical protein
MLYSRMEIAKYSTRVTYNLFMMALMSESHQVMSLAVAEG